MYMHTRIHTRATRVDNQNLIKVHFLGYNFRSESLKKILSRILKLEIKTLHTGACTCMHTRIHTRATRVKTK